MSTKEELLEKIAAAEAELAELDAVDLEDIADEGIQSAGDYAYWKGSSLLGIDIEQAKFLHWGEAKHTINLSFCEMDSSEEMDLRIIRHWKQEPVVERGEVTHFRKVDIVEKRYTWGWELIDG